MSKKKPQVIADQIQVVSINIFRAKLETTEAFLEQPTKLASFEFGLVPELAFNRNTKIARCRLFFSLNALNEHSKPLGVTVEYGIDFQFHIANLEEFIIEQKEQDIQMDATIGATILAMAYSTARGIIFERTRGTFFDGVLIPVVDPTQVLLKSQK